MKLVVQRVKEAMVQVDGEVVGSIGRGLVALVGITHGDTGDVAVRLAKKMAELRIFADDEGKMNRSLQDVRGEVLSISQFTLYADCRKGRRPSFAAAAHPDAAFEIYRRFNEALAEKGIRTQLGRFGAQMDVSLVNDGPVTLILDSGDF